MPAKRKIKAKDIVTDIRAGINDRELMTKYQLSSKGLQSIFHKLLHAKAIRESELSGRMSLSQDTVDLDQNRKLPRNYILVPLPIYDVENMAAEGRAIDITEKGLQVTGIEGKIGEDKGFVIQADEFADVYPFHFTARCKWMTGGSSNRAQPIAGYEITSLSDGSLKELRNLIRLLSLGG